MNTNPTLPSETEADPEVETETETETGTDSTPAPGPTTLARRSLWARLAGVLGTGVVGAGFWLVAEEPGLIVAAVIGFCWYFLSSQYAVAIGHGAFLLFVTGTLPPEPGPALLIAELGLGVLLIAPAIDTDAPTTFVGVFLGSLGGLLALAAGAYWWSGLLWIAAAVLLGALALAGYGLYRYQLVRLGLVEGDPA